MVEDDGMGPPSAALWLLSSVIIDPDSVALTPGWLSAQVAARGFAAQAVQDVIPGITKLLLAAKPRA
jgi:hypothetical protein